MKKILLAFLVLCLSSCGIVRIEYGAGGGFAAQQTTHVLMSNGQLTAPDGTIKQVDRQSVKALMRESAELEQSYVHPGNTYNFIHIVYANKQIDFCWPFGDQQVNPKVVELYKKLVVL